VQLPDPLAGRLERLVATAQAEERSPSVVAAVVRDVFEVSGTPCELVAFVE